MSNWNAVDAVMREFSPRLREDLGLSSQISNTFGTTIAAEVSALPADVLRKIRDEDEVGLKWRLRELRAFEQFMGHVRSHHELPGDYQPLKSTAFVCQLYFGFVYFNEACFVRFRDLAVEGSTLQKCCVYLTAYPVQGLRNAVMHSNWRHTSDAKGIQFHYKKYKQRQVLEEATVTLLDLNYWALLARLTASVVYGTIIDAEL
jgi:hypothetical protein